MMTAPFLHAHSEGNKIQASIRKTLIYRFHKELKEDDVYSITNFGFASNSGAFRGAHHEYKLSFQYGTRVSSLDHALITASPFTFVELHEIATNYDQNYLAGDVIHTN
ncbi:unnamed protein product [Cuscuta europaea]|uniref:Replication protein A 70 kDa DNA-binding subunit B/D first OB fold domain-containing protein n=1 Tax=Cuscuta europaea TaxID=41803 RepID=A0A9P0ZFB9_CUSEU|nr:unnamed protein product [Cuscuta europaea]